MAHERRPSVTEMIRALGLMEEDAFLRRFEDAIGRHPDPEMRERLKEVPRILEESALSKRLGARVWERTSTPAMDDEFIRTAERLLLKTFLQVAESDIRVTTYVARHAPNQEVRAYFDRAAEVEREATETLREAAKATVSPSREERLYSGVVRCTQAEEPAGDLRGQVEGAIRDLRARNVQPRSIILSHTALRHLRDQGLLRGGETAILGVPVEVDLAWEASEFAVRTYESKPLEEIVQAPQD